MFFSPKRTSLTTSSARWTPLIPLSTPSMWPLSSAPTTSSTRPRATTNPAPSTACPSSMWTRPRPYSSSSARCARASPASRTNSSITTTPGWSSATPRKPSRPSSRNSSRYKNRKQTVAIEVKKNPRHRLRCVSGMAAEHLNFFLRDAAYNRQFECFALIRLDHQDDPQSEAQQTHERRQHDQKRDITQNDL